MKTSHFLVTLSMAALTFIMSGCSSLQDINEPLTYPVMVNGQKVMLKQITEGTWTAHSPAHLTAWPGTPENVAALRQAIETKSGCKVTDSDFTRQGKQFDAQVDCGSNLSN